MHGIRARGKLPVGKLFKSTNAGSLTHSYVTVMLGRSVQVHDDASADEPVRVVECASPVWPLPEP